MRSTRTQVINKCGRLGILCKIKMARRVVGLLMVVVMTALAESRSMSKVWPAVTGDFSGYCSDESIPTGSSYWSSLSQTLTDLIQNTPLAANMSYSVRNGGNDVSAYGQAQCFQMSSPDPCKTCIQDLVKRAWRECGDAIAAMLTIKGQCTIRYQDSPLL